MFTCASLLDISLEAAQQVGISKENIFLLPVPDAITTEEMRRKAKGFRDFDDLVEEGRKLKQLEELRWEKGYAAKKVAFISYSSGTSGLPVGQNPNPNPLCFFRHVACMCRR